MIFRNPTSLAEMQQYHRRISDSATALADEFVPHDDLIDMTTPTNDDRYTTHNNELPPPPPSPPMSQKTSLSDRYVSSQWSRRIARPFVKHWRHFLLVLLILEPIEAVEAVVPVLNTDQIILAKVEGHEKEIGYCNLSIELQLIQIPELTVHNKHRLLQGKLDSLFSPSHLPRQSNVTFVFHVDLQILEEIITSVAYRWKLHDLLTIHKALRDSEWKGFR